MSLRVPNRADGSAEVSYRLLLSQLVGARMATKRSVTLFLGAGCSLTSVPAEGPTVASTKEIVASLVDEWLYRPESGRLSETALWNQFHELWIKQGLEQRRHDVAQRLEGLRPSRGYRALARLAAQGCFSAIITTNFDLLLDQSLAGVPHETQVGPEHFEPAPNGHPVLQLVKVHGDIRRGGLLFEPRELHRLPEALSQRIWQLTQGPTLVVGYGGQDHGIMTSLCREPSYNAFWASPRPPAYDQEYHYAPILDWLQSRNSRSNFIFGDELGYFDELFVRLEEDLTASAATAVNPEPAVHDNFVLTSLRISPRLSEVYSAACALTAAEYRNAPPDVPAPFAAPSPSEARETLANCLSSNLVPAATGLVLRNEMESLAFALAIEMSAYVGLGTKGVETFVRGCQEAHNSNSRSIQIGGTIWDLVVALCNADERPIPPAELRVHFNGKTQLTLLSECAEPNRLKAALRLTHALCWLAKGDIAPVLLESEFAEALTSLRNKIRDVFQHDDVVTVRIDPVTADEVSLLEAHIPGLVRVSSPEDRPFVLEGATLRLEAEELRKAPKPLPGASETLAELVRTSAAASVRAFVAAPDPYGAFRRDSVPISIDNAFTGFVTATPPGLMIVGESGTGKTSAVRRFITSCEESGKGQVLVRTPRISAMSSSFHSLFFPFLAELPDKARKSALRSLNDSLDQRDQRLYLVLDGLNEFDADLEGVMALYRDLLEFNAYISEAGLSRIKTVTTVRSHFFARLSRACSAPSREYFYSRREREDGEAAFVRVEPLDAHEIEGIARLCFRADVASAFLELLRNIPRLAKEYAHPVLLAVAGQVIQSPDDIGSLRQSALLFQRFADQMLERLGDADQQHNAIETIHAYFEIQIHQQSSGVITEFALSKGLGRAASEVVRQVSDARIFRISPRGTVTFSHDRIAEHFLGHYLLHNLHRVTVIASAFRKTAENALYFGGLISLVSRLLAMTAYSDDQDSLDRLHELLRNNVLADGAPTSELLVEALCDFDQDDGLLLGLDQRAPDADEFRRSFAHGLWRAAEKHTFDDLRDRFDGYRESLVFREPAHTELCCALAHAALSDSTNADFSAAAERYLSIITADGLRTSGPIWQDRHRMARAKFARQRGQIVLAIEELSDLYESQLKQAAWTHAAVTALELGRAYRDNTQKNEALAVYAKLAEHGDKLGEPMASRLALQTATVEKNVVQELVRAGHSKQDILRHFENALRSLDVARRRSRAARLVMVEIEAAVERVELFLAAPTAIDMAVDLAREACRDVTQLLTFHPNHRQLVAFRRQLAKIACIEGRYGDAVTILEHARQLAENTDAHFYAADCDYQLGHMVARSGELASNPLFREKGIAALRRAIDFYERNCTPDIEYKRHCIEALAGLES